MNRHKQIGWANVLEVNWPNTDGQGTAIKQLREGVLQAIIVRNAYSVSEMHKAVGKLEIAGESVQTTYFPKPFKSWFYGQNLNLLRQSLHSYFQEADIFNVYLESLFGEDRSPSKHITQILESLDSTIEYLPAPGLDFDQSYMFATIRGHGEGGYIPPHFDNEIHNRPSYQHLSTLVKPNVYSAVLTIGAPDSGGELELFNCNQAEHAKEYVNYDSDQPAGAPSRFESAVLTSAPGDLMIVDSGRYLHRVVPVVGTKTRWVMCSFMAESLERLAAYCWG